MWKKNLDTEQTIYALATGSLPSALAVIRISGPKSFEIVERLTQRELKKERGMVYGLLRDPAGAIIDDVLILSFIGPKSATGQDVIEIQCHGSVAVVETLLHSLGTLGARQAEPGEFSYRAYMNGKLDPNRLDYLADLFSAKDPLYLQPLHQRLDGSLERLASALRSDLVTIQAILDTAIDFSDEYSQAIHLARPRLEVVIQSVAMLIKRFESFKGRTLHPKLVIAGCPNAGKSSLFNAILCRYRAIVDPSPGTTRDVLEETVDLGGRPWSISDTAGLREAQSKPEAGGIELGAQYLQACSFWLLVVDGTKGFSAGDRDLLGLYGHKPHLILWNKMDLPNWISPSERSLDYLSLSAATGENLDALLERLKQLQPPGEPELGPLPSASHYANLKRTLTMLQSLLEQLDKGLPPEYLAETNRSSIGALESLFGTVDEEEVLDRVFSEFCIGK